MKKALSDALAERGYETLTPVQEAVTEAEATGRDLLVSAQTGSGKTVGFGMALADTLLGDEERFERASAPLALAIAPTRELAMQVKRELEWLYAKAGVVMASTVGGMDSRDERRTLQRGTHIVVATPGRLRDHIMRGAIDLSQLRAVVLDEADEMLDLGFREDLEFILGECPPERRTLLFSATVPASIAKLAKTYQNDALRISTVSKAKQHSDIEYKAFEVGGRDGENAIVNVLRYYEASNALVFGNTRATVNRLTTRLSNRGFSVVSLSGELSQTERTHALQAMRDGRAKVCVATDVAARGIDLPGLDLVIHAELPTNQETMLHRSGRTGRAGRKGVSCLIVTPQVRNKAQRLLGWAKLTAEWGPAPSADMVREADRQRMMADPAWHDAITEQETAPVAELVEKFSAEQIAAAYLRIYSAKTSAPEELSAPGVREERKPKSHADFGPSTWFEVSGGRAVGAEPRRVLPMICKAGGLGKDDIGAIRVQQDASFVEIRQSAVEGFLKQVPHGSVVEDDTIVTKLDKAPEFSARAPNPGKPGSDRPKASYSGKPKYEGKPKSNYGDKPKYGDKHKYDDKPKSDYKPKSSSAPKVWDDERAPKPRKPKPASKGGSDSYSSKPKTFAKKARPEDSRPDGVVTPKERKPRHKASGKGPSGGKAPAVGKPNSKKNKARRAEGVSSKGGTSK